MKVDEVLPHSSQENVLFTVEQGTETPGEMIPDVSFGRTGNTHIDREPLFINFLRYVRASALCIEYWLREEQSSVLRRFDNRRAELNVSRLQTVSREVKHYFLSTLSHASTCTEH